MLSFKFFFFVDKSLCDLLAPLGLLQLDGLVTCDFNFGRTLDGEIVVNSGDHREEEGCERTEGISAVCQDLRNAGVRNVDLVVLPLSTYFNNCTRLFLSAPCMSSSFLACFCMQNVSEFRLYKFLSNSFSCFVN